MKIKFTLVAIGVLLAASSAYSAESIDLKGVKATMAKLKNLSKASAALQGKRLAATPVIQEGSSFFTKDNIYFACKSGSAKPAPAGKRLPVNLSGTFDGPANEVGGDSDPEFPLKDCEVK